jgi:hypothetical protein
MNQELINILLPYLSCQTLMNFEKAFTIKNDHWSMLLYNHFNIISNPRDIYMEIINNSIPISQHKMNLLKDFKDGIPERVFQWLYDNNQFYCIFMTSNHVLYTKSSQGKYKIVSYSNIRKYFNTKINTRICGDYQVDVYDPIEIEHLGGFKYLIEENQHYLHEENISAFYISTSQIYTNIIYDVVNKSSFISFNNFKLEHYRHDDSLMCKLYKRKNSYFIFHELTKTTAKIIERHTLEELIDLLTDQQKMLLLKFNVEYI